MERPPRQFCLSPVVGVWWESARYLSAHLTEVPAHHGLVSLSPRLAEDNVCYPTRLQTVGKQQLVALAGNRVLALNLCPRRSSGAVRYLGIFNITTAVVPYTTAHTHRQGENTYTRGYGGRGALLEGVLWVCRMSEFKIFAARNRACFFRLANALRVPSQRPPTMVRPDPKHLNSVRDGCLARGSRISFADAVEFPASVEPGWLLS